MSVAISILSIPGSRIKLHYPFETFQYECCCDTHAATFFTVQDALAAAAHHVEEKHPLGWESEIVPAPRRAKEAQ